MKTFLLCLLLTSHLFAETWLELAETADFHQDHPGKKFAEVKPDSPRLDFLEKRKTTLEKIVSGEPAIFPTAWLDPEWLSQFMIAQLDLANLLKFRAAQQQWDEVFALLELAGQIKATILASEPTIIWSMIASANAHSTYECVSHLSKMENSIKKRITLRKLRRHWLTLQATPADFLLSQKGETRYMKKVSLDFKAYLRSVTPNLDNRPFLWDSECPHQPTTRELLEFAYDPQATLKESLANLNQEYTAIRNPAPLKPAPQKPEAKPLEYYHNHPNGLVELYNAGTGYFTFQDMFDHRLTLNLIHETAWKWLLAEADDQDIAQPKDITDLLSTAQQKELVARKIKIDFDQDLISAPASRFLHTDIKTEIRVHDIFKN